MNRDLSGEEHREYPSGSMRVFDGRNAIGSRGSPTDCRSKVALPEESGHDFIAEVKVESESIDDYSSLVRGDAHLETMETFQSSFQTFQDALRNEHVKQESCGSPSKESSKIAQLLEDFIVEVKVEPEFIDDYSSLVRGEGHMKTMETFQSFFQTFQDALRNEHVKQESCGSPSKESSKIAQLLEEKQMKLVSCSNCSQLFDLEVFNPLMTQSICQETHTFSSASYNRSCKSCTETLKNIQGSDTPPKCSVCDKSFTVLSSLNPHENMHTNAHQLEEKHYKCYLCPKSFAQSKSFIEHHRMHAGEKTFKCSVCNKAFNYSSELRKHERVHSGEKPFKCSLCCKVFSRLSNFKVHQRVHSGEKPYLCPVCGNAFARLPNLYRHQKVHSEKSLIMSHMHGLQNACKYTKLTPK
uniref:zinc finger protein 721-like n=1 Tax=Myxine glutinosa TaxID=7769 RepID=UPI00358DF2F4